MHFLQTMHCLVLVVGVGEGLMSPFEKMAGIFNEQGDFRTTLDLEREREGQP